MWSGFGLGYSVSVLSWYNLDVTQFSLIDLSTLSFSKSGTLKKINTQIRKLILIHLIGKGREDIFLSYLLMMQLVNLFVKSGIDGTYQRCLEGLVLLVGDVERTREV